MYMLYSPRAARVSGVILDDAIRDVLLMLEPRRREYEVRFDAAQVLPGLSVLVPEGGFRQILFNLVANAIEASPPGGVVAVAAEVDDGNPDLARISVRDQGRGIPTARQPHIFEPSFGLAADEQSKGGLGLGLSIVKSVVDAAGGRIEFDSAPGVGTTFRVFLLRNPEALEE